MLRNILPNFERFTAKLGVPSYPSVIQVKNNLPLFNKGPEKLNISKFEAIDFMIKRFVSAVTSKYNLKAEKIFLFIPNF